MVLLELSRLTHGAKEHAHNLPKQTLTAWTAKHPPANDWMAQQIETFADLGMATNAGTFVLGEHRVGSTMLPVVMFVLGGGSALAVVRDNYRNRMVTVLADDPVDLGDWRVDGTEPIYHTYCEGFPRPLVCGRYVDDPCAFTIELQRQVDLSELLGVLARHVGSGVR